MCKCGIENLPSFKGVRLGKTRTKRPQVDRIAVDVTRAQGRRGFRPSQFHAAKSRRGARSSAARTAHFTRRWEWASRSAAAARSRSWRLSERRTSVILHRQPASYCTGDHCNTTTLNCRPRHSNPDFDPAHTPSSAVHRSRLSARHSREAHVIRHVRHR